MSSINSPKSVYVKLQNTEFVIICKTTSLPEPLIIIAFSNKMYKK